MDNPSDGELLTPAQVAKRLKLSEKTLANWRTLGQGPKFLKVGTRVRYRPVDVAAFENQAERDPGRARG